MQIATPPRFFFFFIQSLETFCIDSDVLREIGRNFERDKNFSSEFNNSVDRRTRYSQRNIPRNYVLVFARRFQKPPYFPGPVALR